MIEVIKFGGKTLYHADKATCLSLGMHAAQYDNALFEQHKRKQLDAINAQCQRAINQLTDTYPTGEVTTFDKQEAEARAYLDGAQSHTPLLDALAQHREMDKDELVRRVIEKADAFAAASGAIIGKRQKLEDALNLLTSDANTLNDIAAITW